MVRVRLPAAAICLIVVTMVPAISLSQTSRGQTTATATFAAGCFWCVEEAFDGVAGVLTTTSGYIDGQTKNPAYEQVSSGNTGHTELEVVYDPAKVTYEQLLQTFWRNVDAVDAGGQFCDRGSHTAPGWNCGRAQRLEELWGKKSSSRPPARTGCGYRPIQRR